MFNEQHGVVHSILFFYISCSGFSFFFFENLKSEAEAAAANQIQGTYCKHWNIRCYKQISLKYLSQQTECRNEAIYEAANAIESISNVPTTNPLPIKAMQLQYLY